MSLTDECTQEKFISVFVYLLSLSLFYPQTIKMTPNTTKFPIFI